MKKIAMITAALFAFTTSLSAQFGIVGGVGLANTLEGFTVVNDDNKVYDSEGCFLGIDYGIKLSRHLSVIPGARYHIWGNGEKVNTCQYGSFQLKTGVSQSSLEIPLLVKYAYPISANNALNLFAFAGASYNIGLTRTLILDDGDCYYYPYSGTMTMSDKSNRDYSAFPDMLGTAPKNNKCIILGVGVGYGDGYSVYIQYSKSLDNLQVSGYDPSMTSILSIGIRYCPVVKRMEEERAF